MNSADFTAVDPGMMRSARLESADIWWALRNSGFPFVAATF